MLEDQVLSYVRKYSGSREIDILHDFILTANGPISQDVYNALSFLEKTGHIYKMVLVIGRPMTLREASRWYPMTMKLLWEMYRRPDIG